MKHIRKLTVLLLTLAMLFSMAITANAEETNTNDDSSATYKLTITGTKAGHTYDVYQIFTGDISGTAPNYVLSNVKYGKNYGTEGQDVADTVLAGITDADTFAQSVTTVNDPFKNDVASTEGNTEISGLPAGYYLVKEDGSLTGNTSYTKFILQVVGDTSIAVKDGVPTVEKKVKENVKTVTGNTDTRIPSFTLDTGYNDVADYNIGDSVPFELIGTLPSNYADYETYKYYFIDTLSSGLTYNSDAKVYVVNNGVESEITSSFAIAYSGTSLTVKCDDLTSVESVSATSYIVVKYTATLNSGAVIGLNGNPNEVYLQYSNNPNKGQEGSENSTGETPHDYVIVFTYELDVTKVDGATKGDDGNYSKKLPDAKFVLKNSAGKYYKKTDDAVAWVDSESDATVLTSDANGKFSVVGLDDGTYTLVEKEAPDGYNKLTNGVELTVAATTANNQTWTGTNASDALTKIEITSGNKTTEGNTDAGTVDLTVENNAGLTLPSTGGMGTTIFYIVGGLLVAKKRMGAAE